MPSDLHPAKNGHPVDWGAVRLSAIVHGVRQAARLHGVTEWAALKRSKREGWLKDPAARNAASLAVKHRALVLMSSDVLSDGGAGVRG